MNYIKLHDTFVNYCKSTLITDRMQKRNSRDFRLEKDYIYTELHHIIPKHAEGTDDEHNYIDLLPEEHLFIHKLRWKAYKERGDMLAVRFILNGINNKTQKKERFRDLKLNISKKLFQAFAFIKQNSAEVRSTHGWQSEDGRRRISEAMKNKLVCRDITTGELVGKHDKNHPNIVSGQWVHHTTGKLYSDEVKLKQSISRRGTNNANYSGITDAEIIKYAVEITNELGEIPKFKDLRTVIDFRYNIMLPHVNNKFRFPDIPFYEAVENKTSLIYNPYKRGEQLKEYKNKIKRLTSNDNN